MRGAERPLLVAGATAFPGFSFRWVSRTPSTQDLVRAAARAGAAAGHLVAAGEQTAGRGRQGRRWEAPPGGALLASILLRPRAGAEGVPLAAGLAVTDALARLGVEARLKWPNDVLAGGGKLAGILAEVEPAAPGPGVAVVLGIGVNLRVDAFPEGVAGASLHRLLAHVPTLQNCCAIVAIAGMEGALPSVIGGLVPCPVFAVPTSIGYGAHFNGLAALLAMLNSCASNVTVVNIDNGFGAALSASLVHHQILKHQLPAPSKPQG